MSIQNILLTPVQYLAALRDLLLKQPLRRHVFRTMLSGLFFWVLSVGIFLSYRQEFFTFLFPNQSGVVGVMLSLLFTLGGLVLTSLFSLFLMLIFGAVFLEALVVDAFHLKGQVIERSPGMLGFINTMARGLIATVVFLVPVMLLFILSFVFSFLGPLALVSFFLGALGMGLSLLDLPQSVIGLRLGERARQIVSHPIEIITLGACFSLILIIPFGAIIFLPVAYLVAVEKLINWGLPSRTIVP